MKRRDVLKYTALFTGATLSAPIVLSLSGCSPENLTAADKYVPTFFNNDQFKFVQAMVDTILPKTDSPSATEVGVHQIIDQMVGKVYPEESQKPYQIGFDLLYGHLNQEGSSKGFVEESDDQKLSILQSLDSSKDANLKDIKSAYLTFKQQTVAYYLSTKEIGTNFLNYLPVPGPYQACIPLSEVGGKAWAI